jgi:NADPH:quinone reductase-like Zn-dependent oxidoreductase
MKAVVCDRYGPPDVLRFEELAEPVAGEAEIVVRVHATTVTTADSRVRAMRMPSPAFGVVGRLALGLRGPRRRVLGTELSGIVESVGGRVTRFRVGERVVAVLGARFGAHAELVRISETSAIVPKPEELSWEEAASVPFGTLTALYFLRDLARIRGGQRLLVVGASGSVGLAAVQLGRHFGAEVHGVCGARNAGLITSLGASRVYDYAAEDFAASDSRYDAVLDTLGVTTYARCRRVLSPGGVFLPVVLTFTEIRQMVTSAIFGTTRVRSGVTPERAADLEYVMGLARSGAVRPIIDRCVPMAEIVAAHDRVDSGRKVGSVVVRIEG